MASSQPSKTASTNKGAIDGSAVAGAVERYLKDLQRAPLAARTKEAYATHVGAYGAWLVGRGDGADPLGDPRARDYAARDFKRHLKVDRGWKPASVNLALAAVDHFNRFLGLGPANVKREPLAQAAPRALSEDQQRALLRAAEACRPRDRAIVMLLLYTMPRLHELAALDVDDVSISARKGLLVIRSGKGDVYREVPLSPSCRKALAAWLTERRERVSEEERALFTGPQGRRLSSRAIDLVVRNVGERAGLALSAHVYADPVVMPTSTNKCSQIRYACRSNRHNASGSGGRFSVPFRRTICSSRGNDRSSTEPRRSPRPMSFTADTTQKQQAIDGTNLLVATSPAATELRRAHRLPRSALVMPTLCGPLMRLRGTFSSGSA